MQSLPLLSVLIWLPILGGAATLMVGNGRPQLARWLALAVALVTLVVSIPLFSGFDMANAGMQFVEQHAWIPAYDIRYHLGADGISVALIGLTTLTTALVLIGAWGVDKRVSQYYATLLILEGVMIGVFAAMDAMLFYVFFEAMLIPMFIIIGVWGGPRRVYASVKFFLYTFLGSVFMLVGLIYLYLKGGSWQLADMVALPLSMPEQVWLFFAFLIAFAVKVPMFPVHTWLPDAHVEAPTAGSVILAGVLLKLGTYGFYRFNLPMFPAASKDEHFFGAFGVRSVIVFLAIVSILYGALAAMYFVVKKDGDVKKLVAYSSVSSMGMVMLGLFALNPNGVNGGVMQMINHGIYSGALFLLVGIIYERRHTRNVAEFGGLSHVMPGYAAVFLGMVMTAIGLPLLAVFISEFLALRGAFEANVSWAAWAALGIILNAGYFLWLYQRMFFGTIDNPKNEKLTDLNLREWAYMVPLLIMSLWIGVYPKPFLGFIEQPVNSVVKQVRPEYQIPGMQNTPPTQERAQK